MNKQPVDAQKLLKWLESDKRAEAFWIDGLDSTVAFDNLSDAIDAGELAPDPIPLPTIKPGDQVVITDAMNPDFIGTKAIVEKISKSSPYSAILKEIAGDWPLSSLEVSHD
ncbi:hypothetical protein NYE69_33245 [Paenibacillus sp. FSL R5-0527]|uniref:hypothetical protein n=1 Tax=Paenibacillus sp. FSL R5-0527 TaxID=2975321 RepID=UPI00097B6A9A|nr:hypothetical protein BK140_32470 [Paenibacillus macerans]